MYSFLSLTCFLHLTLTFCSTSAMVLHEWVLHIPQTSRHYYTFEIDLYDGPYYMNETFSKLMLEEHNKLREIHGAQKLRWSTDMFEFASQYALKYNCSGILEHSGARVGENLAYGYSPQEAIQAWYEEGETYPYGTEEVYNHFTAIVWNNTESMGCAYKQCANAGLYITCNYDPPGNVINHSSRNVFPPLI